MRPIALAGRQRTRLRALTLSALALLALGASSATSALADDNPPLAYGGSVSPASLDFHGGQVTITAGGLDDFGVFMAYANVTGPDGFYQDVQLVPSQTPSDPNEPTTYQGTLTVPGNSYPYPVDYYFNSTITDTNGQSASAWLGQVTVGEIQEEDEEPYLWEPTLSTRSLPSTGGPLTLGVSTYDDSAVDSASAKVTGPGDFTVEVPLSRTDETRFSGSLSVPANAATNPGVYTVRFSATDDAGQTGFVDGGTFTVATASAPLLGQLQVSPTSQILGPVFAGRTIRRNVVVKNRGRPGSGPVTAVATSTGPFTIVGAGPFGQPLELAAGESKLLVIEFRPRRGGVFAGRLAVTRPDNRQRPLVTALTGIAVP